MGTAGKSLVASKTVWVNVLTAVLAVSDFLPQPIGLALSISANLVMRVFFTGGPITSVLPKKTSS